MIAFIKDSLEGEKLGVKNMGKSKIENQTGNVKNAESHAGGLGV